METFLPLIGYTFQQLFDKAGPALAGAVLHHFTDHSTLLSKALERSVTRAWQALGVALGGDGWLGPITRLFASGDDAAVRKQIEQFLAGSKLGETSEMFRKACLAEWKRLGQAGGLSAARLDLPVLAEAAGRLPALSGSVGLVAGAQQAMAQVADALKPQYPPPRSVGASAGFPGIWRRPSIWLPWSPSWPRPGSPACPPCSRCSSLSPQNV